MSVNLQNLDALLQYDLDLSPRRSRHVLAVVKDQDKTEHLTIVDLKQASIWTKIKLWWNDSTKKATIGNFLSENIRHYSNEIGANHEKRVVFEMQCAKLFQKIYFAHKPEWNLAIKFEYPDTAASEAAPKTLSHYSTITFDRLTTKQEIISHIANQRFQINVNGISLAPRLSEVFSKQTISGLFTDPPTGQFLTNEDTGQDRTCTVTFSELDKNKLLERATSEAVNLGRSYLHVPTPTAQPVTILTTTPTYIAPTCIRRPVVHYVGGCHRGPQLHINRWGHVTNRVHIPHRARWGW